MTAKILEFPGPDTPHLQGRAICLCCQHEWHAVAPRGMVNLQCPECKLLKGVYRGNVVKNEDHWICQCGNAYCLVSRTHVYCTLCGDPQIFPE